MNAMAGAIMTASLTQARDAATAASDEAAVIVQAQAGSLEAFGRIVTRYQGGVFNYLLRRLSSHCDAEDLAQETFVRAWTSLATYNPRWRISTWLYAIATRLAIDHVRSQRSRQQADPRDITSAKEADPAGPLLEREARRNLWMIAQQLLGDEERAALWLKYAENFSSDEIARTLGRSSIAVRVMLFRARRLLAQALGDEASDMTSEAERKGAVP